jgi:hypothetical protein
MSAKEDFSNPQVKSACESFEKFFCFIDDKISTSNDMLCFTKAFTL